VKLSDQFEDNFHDWIMEQADYVRFETERLESQIEQTPEMLAELATIKGRSEMLQDLMGFIGENVVPETPEEFLLMMITAESSPDLDEVIDAKMREMLGSTARRLGQG